MSIAHATDTTYTSLRDAAGVVVVDFHAAWCAPCKALSPILDEISEENPEISVVKVDVDAAPNSATAAAITSVPTLLFYKDGALVDEIRGATSKRALLAKLPAN